MTETFNVHARPSPISILRNQKGIGAMAVLVLMIPLFALLSPNFLTASNLKNVGLQTAILLLLALPMTLVIFTEGLDLSMGAVLSLCGVVLALQLVQGYSISTALLGASATGVLFGLLNGFCVAVLRMPPFVVTLGSFGIAQGLALAITDGNAVSNLGSGVEALAATAPLGVPLIAIIAAVAYLGFHVLTSYTKIGRYAIALGGNKNALVTSGVNATAYHVGIYALAGLTSGIAALCLIVRTNSGHPTIAIGMEFDAIAAVVLGGTQLERGKGWLFGSMLGVFAIGILRNGLNLLGVDTSLQLIAIGSLVLLVVWLSASKKGHAE
jgi:ribose transport system permease protein